MDLLNGQISESQLNSTLRTPIAKIGRLENSVNAINGNLGKLNNSIGNLNDSLNNTTSQINAEKSKLATAVKDINTLMGDKTAKTAELANLTQTLNSHTSSIRDLGVTTGELTQKYTQLKTASDTANSKIAQIKQTQAGQAIEQNSLKTRFDNLVIGGRNLLIDSEFKRGKWLFAGHNNQETHNMNSGVLTIGSDIAYWKHAKLIASVSGLDKILQIGETYTFSVWARSTQGQKTVFISIRNWKDGQFSENIAKRQQVGEIWQRIVVTSVYRQTPHNGQYLDVLLEHGEIGEVEFKQPKLEVGSVATDWTPAPEDLESGLSSVQATIDSFKSAQATKDTATAQQITTLQTTLNGQTSSIQTQAQSIDGLKAQYTVKIDSGGRVAGFGLASGNGVSDFTVRADKFYIAPPNGNSKGDSPFMVLTTPTNINGTIVPSGTYIKSAYIANGSIDNLQVKDGAISTAKIANASISNAKIMDLSVSTLKIQDRAVTVPHTFTDTNPRNFENKRLDAFEKSETGRTIPEISQWVLHGLTPNTEIMVIVDVGRLYMSIQKPNYIAYSKDYDCAVRLGIGHTTTASPDDWDILNHSNNFVVSTQTFLSGAFFRRLTVPANGMVDLKLWCSAYGAIHNETILTAKTDKVTWYVLELKK